MIEITPIEAFNDNYIWLLADTASGRAAVVDPGDPQPVLDTLRQRQLQLTTVLITHHHMDHIGGLRALADAASPTVYGPPGGHIEGLTQTLNDGDQIQLFDWRFSVLAVPGHTLDHIAYFSDSPPDQPVLFCGDTLFAGGCGRLFEGSPQQMYQSLSRLSALPDTTRVYCAHEYTLANLAFASAVEPGNRALAARVDAARALREQKQPTVPSTLQLERETNPFLRSHTPAVQQAAAQHSGEPLADDTAVFAAIRRWKDQF